MTQVLVRYKTKPEHIAGNDQLVRTAHDELQRTEFGGFQRATFQAGRRGDAGSPGLNRERRRANTADKAGRVRRFQHTNGDRCDEPRTVTQLREIGSPSTPRRSMSATYWASSARPTAPRPSPGRASSA